MLKTFAAGTLVTFSLLALGCSDDDGSGSNGNAANEREEFIQDAEDRIAELRAELEEIRQDIAEGDAGAEVEEQADALESRVQEAEAELDEIRNASDDEWEDLKDSAEQTLDDAGDLVEEIGSEIGIN